MTVKRYFWTGIGKDRFWSMVSCPVKPTLKIGNCKHCRAYGGMMDVSCKENGPYTGVVFCNTHLMSDGKYRMVN